MSVGFGREDPCEDEVLFDSLFEQHHRALFAYLLGRCGDREIAADLLQEAFVRVWRNVGEARQIPVERRRYWMVAIAGSVLIDCARRRAVRARVTCPAPAVEPVDSGPSPHAVAEGRDELARLDAAIRALPEDLRTALVLSVMEGLSSAEIAATLGVPAGTVRSRISEARSRIARKVGLS
jgi:RNA polymerase sigma-70 factor (ECF subfamily)